MFAYITDPKQVSKVLNDIVLLKTPKTTNEYVTASGIYLSGVEHDYTSGEVVMANRGWYNDDGTYNHIELVPGDKVLLEKNFSHRYGADFRNRDGSLRRERIDHLVQIGEDDSYRYFLVSYEDIYMKEVPKGTPGAIEYNMDQVRGTLYSLILPKQVTRVEI